MNEVRRRVLVGGRVQGVGFRWFTLSAARRLGLVGWVKNQRDGSVLCEAQGPTDDLESFVEQLGRGPRLARVEQLTVEDLDPAPQRESEFEVTS